MVIKFNYKLDKVNGIVTRTPEYTFTEIENLGERLEGIDNPDVISNIAKTTLKGEAERNLIELEDEWFKAQSDIQQMDIERAKLEEKLKRGDENGNPLTPDEQKSILSKIAECSEGTMKIEKEFYDHYTRKTYKVEEIHQTPYTIALELRNDLEANNGYLAGFRGEENAPERPLPYISPEKEIFIKKELVRQRINIEVGDSKDLIADMSNALSVLIKKVNGETITEEDQEKLSKYINRQIIISDILNKDYKK